MHTDKRQPLADQTWFRGTVHPPLRYAATFRYPGVEALFAFPLHNRCLYHCALDVIANRWHCAYPEDECRNRVDSFC